jgi:hypothetical protein
MGDEIEWQHKVGAKSATARRALGIAMTSGWGQTCRRFRMQAPTLPHTLAQPMVRMIVDDGSWLPSWL